jgi:wyosine [tRNA(Phe)-imidazoG37] synthetase (radical SAM superfamily)
VSYIPMQKSIIYGPIASKRLRRSLGVNLSPIDKKVCTFNCVYCHYGPTHVGQYELPAAEDVVSALEERLKERPIIDYITFAGNGEPTLHPDFLEIVRAVRRVRDRFLAGTPIALLSNSTQLGRSDVVEAAGLIDFPVFKLDAGDGATLHDVNRPVAPTEIEEIVDWLCRLHSPAIQTVVLGGRADTSGGTALESWLDAVGRIRPRLIQLYSPDRPIVSQEVVPVPAERLRQIARYVRDSMGLDARVF